jgi:hypothetical protein
VLEQVGAETALEKLGRWQEVRGSWSDGWREHSGVTRSTIYLTEDELADLMQGIEALILEYVEQRPLDDLASRPAGSKAVTITQIMTVSGGGEGIMGTRRPRRRLRARRRTRLVALRGEPCARRTDAPPDTDVASSRGVSVDVAG